jgi:hypothetical protein
MIVSNYFDGDENDVLKWVQHDAYGDALTFMYRSAADRYLKDIRYTWVSPDFVPKIRHIDGFDHRVLQLAHDLVAAYYRFAFCSRLDKLDLPEDFNDKEYYLGAWRAYYRQEMGLLAQKEEIAEAILIAVAFQNTDRGYAAEDKLQALLVDRYKAMKLISFSGKSEEE